MLSFIQLMCNCSLYIVIAFANFRQLDFSSHFFLLHLTIHLLLSLLGLIESYFLLKGTVLHLLILKHQRLDLAI